MKQYLKMGDEFTSEVRCEDGMLVTDDTYYANIHSDGDLICHAINSHDELVEMNKELIAKCEKMQKDSDRWKFVLDAADDMKTSRYETLCSLLRVDVDDEFDLARQIDKVIGGAE